MKKKLLILFISIFAFMSTTNALTLSKGDQYNKADDADNIVRLPVKYQSEQSEVVTQVTLKCSVYDDVEGKVGSSLGCSFEGGKDETYTSATANLDPSKEYSVDLIVTNPTTTKKSVYVKVEATWQGSSAAQGPKSFIQSVADVKAKKVETPPSNISTLANLKFSKGKMSPDFSKDVQEYTVYDIADTINSITYDYTCSDKNCTIADVSGGTSVSGNKIVLAKGENKIYITSKSADGTSTTKYTFTVYRGETSFNSSKLKYIEIQDGTLDPTFNKDITSYTITLPTSTTSIKEILSYESLDKNAKIEVEGADKLKEGENLVKIAVTNVSEEETITYEIKVVLEDKKAIKVVAYIDAKVTFLVEGGDETTIAESEFEKKYPEEYAKIKNGTYVFDKDGKRVEKQVETKEKTIGEDEEQGEKKSSKAWVVILLIVLGVAIIGVSAYFIFFKKPKDENDDKKNKDNKKGKKEEEKEDTKEVEETEESESTEDEEEKKKPSKKVEEEDEDLKFKRTKTRTVDIDEALSDLMNTQEYDFKTKSSIKKDDE